VFYLLQSSDDAARSVLDALRDRAFNYPDVGATRGEPPAGYALDRYGAELGRGADVFARARDAIRKFMMYPAPWTRVVSLGPIAEGTVFGTWIRHFGFWSLNPCRILDVNDEPERFGFAFGTVEGHSEAGEERFNVVRDADGRIAYDVTAVSRPHHPLARLGAPLARRLQRKFQRESCAAMRSAAG
jgi:uncharacterized protein (UPF0548 family)